MTGKWFALLFFVVSRSLFAELKYENDFEKAEPGALPPDLAVLDGAFQVKQEAGNKFLELPGAPLDRFGLLFGPEAKENVSASARIFGTATGRRFPVFDVGLNGAGGYKLRVSPAKNEIELYKGDELRTTVPFVWQSGKWTHLKIQIVKASDHAWKIEGRVWEEGAKEPSTPSIAFTDSEAPTQGRASIGAMPYSGTPIRFDDLVVSTVMGK